MKTFRLSLVLVAGEHLHLDVGQVGDGVDRKLLKRAQAEADGYVNIHLYLPGEGFHYVKFSLIDAAFDPEQPEVLIYAPVSGENRLELAAVEYLVPLAFSPNAPAGFTGEADQWRHDTEGFGVWELNAWAWLHNPEGIFSHDNPRVP